MNDKRIVKNLTVDELNQVMTDIPVTFFNNAFAVACKNAHESCKADWKNDIHEVGEKITGLDTRLPESKDHLRGVYKFAEGQQQKSKLIGRTAIIEGVKIVLISMMVYFGFKVGK